MKKVSIIVPVHDVENYLRRCIDSILNSTYKNIEVILINDGSHDNSGKICDKYSKKDNRIIVIHQNNSGVSNARNKGLDISKGEYLLFIDSDDYIESNMIEILVNDIDIYDMAICSYYKEKENEIADRILDNDKIIFTKEDILKQIHVSKSICGYIWNKLYKKEIIAEHNIQFKPSIAICEDILFNIEYIDKIKNDVTVTSAKLYHYIIRENSAVNSKNLTKKKTALEAYSQIEDLYKEKYVDELDYLYCGIFQMNFRLRLDSYIIGNNDKKCDCLYKNQMTYCYNRIMKNKDIDLKLKLKILIEKNAFILIRLVGKVIKL